MKKFIESIQKANSQGKLFTHSTDNLIFWLKSGVLEPWAVESLCELISNEAWEELNNRFYKKIEFGTAGMRGRTIGQKVTSVEKGKNSGYQYPAVGTACLNDYNIVWATMGLFRYCKRYLEDEAEFFQRPRIVIAHDTRHFSKHFCECAASTWAQLGGDAYIFDGPRSTPQLSFSVRHLNAIAGIVITASHNPFYDNGYKVYFKDGAQVCDPHAKSIVKEIYQVDFSEIKPFLTKDLSNVHVLSPLLDEAYIECVKEVVLYADSLKIYKPRIVFTPLHGTGAVTTIPILERFELDVHCVERQMVQDSDFPTIKQPNPEYKETLALGIEKAEEVDASVVIATDPDADRMGVAVKNNKGEWMALSGNMVAVLLAEYRISTMIRLKWLPRKKEKRGNAALIKTFVTTPMLEAIAKEYGLKMVETLTGFKWIGAKLDDYEQILKKRIRITQGLAFDYDKTTVKKRKDLLLKHSTFYVFGGEESYGYLANDRVRDKDANASVLMFCEFLAYLKSREIQLSEYLDDLYAQYGYFAEDVLNLNFEGAVGIEKIKKILNSYRNNPPKRLNDVRVIAFNDFGKGKLKDVDGKAIPSQDFYLIKLLDGSSVAIRGSGTEPKLKFYLFGHQKVEDIENLKNIRTALQTKLEGLKCFLKTDAEMRSC